MENLPFERKKSKISFMFKPFKKIGEYFRTLPDKKKYIEVITASLSIPVLLSVVLVNYLNIQDKRKNESITPTPVIEQPQDKTPTIITIIRDVSTAPTDSAQISGSPMPTQTPPPTKAECIKEVGPIDIISPTEGQIVKTNPLEIDINYQQGDYCSVVWSYRINNGTWSEYNDNDILIYNMDSGSKTIELRVKSLASTSSKTLKRTFSYDNTSATVATPTMTPTP